MSEELNNGAAVATPTATEPQVPAVEPAIPATDPLANAEPAAPATVPEAAPAVVEQSQIDAASTAMDNGGNEAPAPVEEPKKEEAAAAEQPPAPEEVIEITEELVSKAIEVIKETYRSSAAMFQRKLGLSLAAVNKLLDELTARGILAAQEGNAPRKILLDLPKREQKPTPTPQPKKFQKPGKPRMTDFDRMAGWKVHLREIGKYTDDTFINAMAEYAQRNPGFNPRAKWGSCLIVMINRLANKTKNSLRTFVQSDVDHLQTELLRFFSEQPLGDNAIAWNENYSTNQDQKRAISQFFGIDKSYRDLRGNPNLCLTAVRDAAWPNREEEQRGTGGTFAERFHYLALAIVKFGSSDFAKALFENSLHTEPTDEFLERVGGVRRPSAPNWIKDGVCSECGFQITKDSRGNDICSNPICEHHFASVANDVAKSFRQGGTRRPRQEGGFAPIDPNSVPVPPSENRRRNWKDKKDRRHDEEGDFPRGNRPKKHGKRWHTNDDDGGELNAPSGTIDGDNGRTVFSSGNGTFGNNAFAGLEIPKAPEAEQLPPSPPEVPVS